MKATFIIGENVSELLLDNDNIYRSKKGENSDDFFVRVADKVDTEFMEILEVQREETHETLAKKSTKQLQKLIESAGPLETELIQEQLAERGDVPKEAKQASKVAKKRKAAKGKKASSKKSTKKASSKKSTKKASSKKSASKKSAKKAPAKDTAPKMADKEFLAEKERAREFIGRGCSFTPLGEDQLVSKCTIKGVMADKRVNYVYFRIETPDGKIHHKKTDSTDLTIYKS